MNRISCIASFLYCVVAALLLTLTACGGGNNDYVGPTSPNPETGNQLSVGGVTGFSVMPVELKRFQITGGRKPYTATSQNSAVVLASVSDSTLSLAGVQSHGIPVIVVISDALKNSIALSVLVSNTTEQGQFSVSPERLAIAPGQTAVVSLTGGTPPFTAFPVNNVLVSVSTLGSAVSVTGLQETSEALVRIVDTAGVSRILPVAVSAQISNTPNASLFTNLPARPVLPPLSSRTYTISGGTPPYNVIAAQPAVLLPQVRGAALILQTGQVGTSQLTITDAAGFRLTYTVQVQGVMSPLSLSATEFSSVVGEKTGVWISGGRPPYRVHTTNGVASGVIRDGNVLWLELMAAGNGIVTVYDADLNQVTMTVNAEKSSLPDKFTLAPQKVTISESLTFDASGNPQATVVPLRLTKAVSPVNVFSSYPGLLIPTLDGAFVNVHTPYQDGKPIPPCVDDDVIVTITVIDGIGQSASTDITIRDTGACTP